MDKPWLLDLFCGAGGAGEGYRRAGFHVVSVDIDPKPLRHNPHEWYVGDALAVLDTLLEGRAFNGYSLEDFDAIHASPICNDYSTSNTWLRPGRERKAHPRLIKPTRERLLRTGKPWVIENVRLALPDMLHPVLICGTALALRVQRHRLFDASVHLFAPGPCQHRVGDVSVRTSRGEYLSVRANGIPIVHRTRNEVSYRNKGCSLEVAKAAMGVDWQVTMHDLGEMIPPAYTEWIGRQLLGVITPRQRLVSRSA